MPLSLRLELTKILPLVPPNNDFIFLFWVFARRFRDFIFDFNIRLGVILWHRWFLPKLLLKLMDTYI